MPTIPLPTIPLRRRLCAAATGLALVLGLAVTTAAPAPAAVPQPGSVPWVNFDGPQEKAGVHLAVSYPVAEGGHWSTAVTICNRTGRALPVGPDAFSYTNFNYGTFFFTTGWTGGMANQVLANTACTSGQLKSAEEPMQMAFHKVLTVNERIDILPATEWEAIFKVREPKSSGTSFVHGDYNGDSIAELNAVQGFNFYTFTTQVPGQAQVPYHLSSITGPGWSWMAKVPDLDLNGAADLLVRKANGSMHYVRMMDSGRRGFENQVGTSWNAITLMAVVPRAGAPTLHPWLVARASNGDLIRYQVSPQGIYGAAKIGRNWNSIAKLFSVGDFSGDGIPDLMAIGTNGLLYRYNMTPTGGIASVNVVGRGWNTFLHAVSPGDMNGDGRWDMIGIRNDGQMFFYSNNGPGRWAAARYVDDHWDGVQLLA